MSARRAAALVPIAPPAASEKMRKNAEIQVRLDLAHWRTALLLMGIGCAHQGTCRKFIRKFW